MISPQRHEGHEEELIGSHPISLPACADPGLHRISNAKQEIPS
jgi:hypothetical protein